MGETDMRETWDGGAAYERYVGRWSRLAARAFVEWLAMRPGWRCLDVGCGTGALAQSILDMASPAAVKGIDRSEEHIAFAHQNVVDPRAGFEFGDAQNLPVGSKSYDVAVSGLVLNFVPEPRRMIEEMARAVRGGGIVALYVWDYAGKMELIRYFWDAAVALDPAARSSDEGVRFPICKPGPLAALFRDAGLVQVKTRAIEIPTDFSDFDDYWLPFLGGQGPAPGYAMSLSEEGRAALRDGLRAALPIQAGGSIHLRARAWAVRGLQHERST